MSAADTLSQAISLLACALADISKTTTVSLGLCACHFSSLEVISSPMDEIQNQNQEVVETQEAEPDHQRSRLIRMMVAFVVIAILAVFGVVFQEQISGFLSDEVEGELSIVIAYAEGFTSVDPTNYEVRNRQYFGNIFEGLTRFDKNLELEPSLAVSWGKLSDDVWEFQIRDGVYFHDGSTLDSADVVASIEYAMNNPESQLVSMLGTVVSVSASGESSVEITTDGFDPLLPNRMAYIYIFPSEAPSTYENLLVGTGPYYAVSFGVAEEDVFYDQEFAMTAFPYYWGFAPKYQDVSLLAIADKKTRMESMINADVDVLVNVSQDSVSDLENSGVDVVSQSGLETNFLVFNTLEGVFAEKELREAFVMAFDREGFVEKLGGYASASDQFVSNGVGGYDSAIEVSSYDEDAARAIFDEYGVTEFEVYMVYEMSAFGAFLEEQFLKIGVNADAIYVTSSELQDAIGEADVYFMGWKSDLGDAADLYESLFASGAPYNGGYDNPDVDALIEQASFSEGSERLSMLKDIMRILVEDDIAGLPLFEAKTIYGFAPNVTWSSRVDGYVWAADLK